MELRHLRYFVTVAEEHNYTRAAERLHIGQPPTLPGVLDAYRQRRSAIRLQLHEMFSAQQFAALGRGGLDPIAYLTHTHGPFLGGLLEVLDAVCGSACPAGQEYP